MSDLKLNDWTTHEQHGGNPKQIESITNGEAYFSVTVGGYSIKLEDLKKWQPKEGEWCWFGNKIDSKSFVLSQFDETITIDHTWDIAYTEVLYKSKEYGLRRYSSCEPFIGELPSYLKEVM